MRRRKFEVPVVKLSGGRGRPPRPSLASRASRAEPTRERMRRAGTEFERGDSGQITMRDSPLERGLARKLIIQEQYTEAPGRLRGS